MVELDLTTVGFIVVLIGWAFTNVQILRTHKRVQRAQDAIKLDIDAKRTQTQEFVRNELQALGARVEAMQGHLEARMSAEMPHPDVAIADMKTELQAKFGEMDRGITAALQSIETAFRGVIGMSGDAERELRKEMALVEGEGAQALEEAAAAMDTSNPVVRRLYAWAAKPVDPKLEAKNPIGAAVLQLGKAALLERLQNSSVGATTTAFLKKGGSYNPGL